MSLEIDRAGFPLLLADVPVKDEPAQTDAETPLSPSGVPPGIDAIEWARRMDAVRDAAREFETLAQQDIIERLRGVTNKPLDDAAVAQFTADVRAAQIDDLVDLLDHAQRGKRRGRRTVKVQAPRGYTKMALHGLSDGEMQQVSSRLRARGWKTSDVKSGLVGKLSPAKASSSSQYL